MELWSSTDLIIYTYNTIHCRKLANSRKANFLTWGKAFKQAFMSIGYSWSCTTPLLVWNSWIIPPTAEDICQSIWVGWYVVSKTSSLSTHMNLSTLMVLVWPTQDISLFVHSAKYLHLISTSNCAQSSYYLPLLYPTTYLAVYTKNTSVFICILQELTLINVLYWGLICIYRLQNSTAKGTGAEWNLKPMTSRGKKYTGDTFFSFRWKWKLQMPFVHFKEQSLCLR